MSKGKIKFDLRVRRHNRGDARQASIENAASDTECWDESYVDFSGFFGDLGPQMFAAAPDMLEALRGAAGLLDAFNLAHSKQHAAVVAAIAKAEGR